MNMTKQVVQNVGAFTQGIKDKINENFTELYLDGLAIPKVAEVLLTAAELGGSETATSFTFPSTGAIFLDAWVNVTNEEAGGTMDVGTAGTSNDPDGILDGVSLAATGYVGQVAGATGALRGLYMTGSDPVTVTSSGDLNSCEATLYVSYLELPSI